MKPVLLKLLTVLLLFTMPDHCSIHLPWKKKMY